MRGGYTTLVNTFNNVLLIRLLDIQNGFLMMKVVTYTVNLSYEMSNSLVKLEVIKMYGLPKIIYNFATDSWVGIQQHEHH